MKKFKQLLTLCAAIVIAAAFFSACPDGNVDPSGVTYTLTVHPVHLTPGDTADIDYTLTASDKSSTAGIPVTFACNDAACTLTVNDTEVTAAAGEDPGNHNFTATAKKDGTTVATKAFTVTVAPLSSIEAALLVIDDMAIYRTGGTEASRTIEFTLFDTEAEPITSHNFLQTVTVEYTSDTLTITDGIIESDKTYAEGKHDVHAVATIGAEELECDFEVTVSKLMFNVKFYHGTEEITAFATSVEYGDPLTDPGNPNISGYNFHEWVTTEGGDVSFDFMYSSITEDTNLYTSELELPPAEYTLTVRITVTDPTMLSDEVVIVQGGWNVSPGTVNPNWGNTDNSTVKLEKQADGTFTGTIPNIQYATHASFGYNLYCEKTTVTINANGRPPTSGNGAMAYAIRAWDISGGRIFTYSGGSSGVDVLEWTVEEWIGRYVPVPGNLLGNSSWEDGTGWNYNNNQQAPWTITLNGTANPSNRWLIGTPSSYIGGRAFQDHDSGNAAATRWVNNGSDAKMTQNVAVGSTGLAAGVKVTLSVWIRRVNTNQSAVKLLVGAQEYDATADLTNETAFYQQISHTFTLAAGDITGSNLTNVGLQYTAANDNCRTFVDDFVLLITE